MNEKKKSAIRKITLNTRTFNGEIIEPTYINFFYGKNGTGKSTVAQALKSGTGVEWADGHTAADYDVLLFDSDFTRRNFETYGNLKGVFTLSEPNIKIQREIEEKDAEKAKLDGLAGEYAERAGRARAEETAERERLLNICWEKAREIRQMFPEAMKGKNTKKNFALAVLDVKTPAEQDLGELGELYRAAYDQNSREYPLFSKVTTAATYGNLPGSRLLNEVLASSGETPLAGFIEALGATDWVRRGHQCYSNAASGRCPYCSRELPEGFESELAACFDEKYRQNLNEIKRFETVYARETQAALNTLKSNLNDTMPSLDPAEYRAELSLLEEKIKINRQRIAEKTDHAAKRISLEDTDSVLIEIGRTIDAINAKIRANNEVVKDRAAKRKECSRAVWSHIAYMLRNETAHYTETAEKLRETAAELTAKAAKARAESSAVSSEIAELEKHTVNTKTAVDNINSAIKRAGFQGFSLREKPGCENVYEVIRNNGAVAEDLSEGERNFISFLYFRATVKGSAGAGGAKDKIVVIDDPVEGMDRDTMSAVSSAVREMIGICGNSANPPESKKSDSYIKQIFIFTHNRVFFREITDRSENGYGFVSFYVIRKENNVSAVGAPKTRKNPENPSETENFNPVQDGYTALWSELKEVNSPAAMINVMRNIIEYYFIRICGYDGEGLRDAVRDGCAASELTGTAQNSTILTAAEEMLADIGSPDGAVLPEIGYNEMPEYREAFKKIFYCMRQERHYNAMMAKS